MLPKYHFLYGFLFSLFLFYSFPEINFIEASIIFLASVLIDVDHYIFYIFTKKDLSLKNAYNWFVKKNKKFMKLSYKERLKIVKPIPCIFHGIELTIILIFLSFISNIFIFILLGILFHQFLDFINAIYYGFPLQHIGSQTYNIINYKKINYKFYT